jgi:hypothetical protein
LPETASTSYERLESEPIAAWHAFRNYRDLGTTRSLAEVSRLLQAENDGSGLRFPSNEQATSKQRKKAPAGNVTLWSSKYNWVARAAEWDRYCDAVVRKKHLSEIEAMAKRHAQQAQIGLESLMAPVLAFARAMRDPMRAVSLETAPLATLLEFSLESLKGVQRLQKAERLARGVKVIDTEPISAPGSSQGGAVWNVIVHQPERAEPLPDLNQLSGPEAEPWEDA